MREKDLTIIRSWGRGLKVKREKVKIKSKKVRRETWRNVRAKGG